MNEANFRVRGHRPIPWGTNEESWRRAVADAARQFRDEGEVDAGDVDDAQFAVDLRFRITDPDIERADLDNLAKPVLNTIFLSRDSKIADTTLTGALFPADDDRVFRLHIEKRMVSSDAEEGVDVRIIW